MSRARAHRPSTAHAPRTRSRSAPIRASRENSQENAQHVAEEYNSRVADAATEDPECAICFEAVGSLGGAVPLPCACHAAFCHTCWDRALAASISACGRARCPSCRCPMRVDFDISLKRLVFSRAAVVWRNANDRHTDPPTDDWQQRLYQQAKPTQIHLLRQYGGRSAESLGGVPVQPWGPWPRSSALDSEPPPPPPPPGEPLQPHQSNPPIVVSGFQPPSCSWLPPSSTGGQPRCVCGSSLHHVSVEERVRVFVTEEASVPPPHHFVERLLASPPIFCDICDRRFGPEGGVWTCENGGRTVLHAAAYDVCEACFALHVHGDATLAVSSTRDPARQRRKGGRIGGLRWT